MRSQELWTSNISFDCKTLTIYSDLINILKILDKKQSKTLSRSIRREPQKKKTFEAFTKTADRDIPTSVQRSPHLSARGPYGGPGGVPGGGPSGGTVGHITALRGMLMPTAYNYTLPVSPHIDQISTQFPTSVLDASGVRQPPTVFLYRISDLLLDTSGIKKTAHCFFIIYIIIHYSCCYWWRIDKRKDNRSLFLYYFICYE